MKNLFKSALLITVGTIALSSCMKKDTDNYDYEAEYKKQEQQLDSLLSAQKIKIEEYKNTSMTNAIEDTVTINFPRLNKKVKRGIWYEVLSVPTTENDAAYEYKGQIYNSNYGSYFDAILPKVKMKYTVQLIGGDVITAQSDLEGSDYDFSVMANSSTNERYNYVWKLSFIPYSIKYNGDPIPVLGLTAKGLKEGSKIRVIAPSYWAFGNKKVGDIPSNSPLIYEFEVLKMYNN